MWEFNLSTPVFLKFLQLSFQFLKGKCQSHASLKITFPFSIKVTGLAIPRGLYVYAEDKRLSTSHFIASFESLKKVTAKLSPALSQWSPSRFALLGLNPTASAVNCYTASNCSTIENLLLKNWHCTSFQTVHLVNSIFANDDVINIISPTYSRKKKRKFLRVVSRSLQDETATAQVETNDCCVNCKVSTCEESSSFIQWNQGASNSATWIHTRRRSA